MDTERFRRKNQYAIWNSIFHSEKCRWRIYVQLVKICSGLHISTDELSQIGKPRNYILQEDRSTYNTKELPDLRSILSSTFLFNGTEYTLSEKKQDMLSQIIQAVLSEKTQ